MPTILDRTAGMTYYNSRGDRKPIGIVDHIMESTIDQAEAWFRSPGRGSQGNSTNFGVSLTGEIRMWINPDLAAWGNGTIAFSSESPLWLTSAGGDPNDYTISIEHEGDSGDPMPEAQYQATLWLHQYLMNLYAIPRTHVCRHRQVDILRKPNCPGTGFPMERLMADLNTTIIPGVLPYGGTVDKDGGLHLNGHVIAHGFLKYFLTLDSAVPQGTLDTAIYRGVKMYGLPLEEETDAGEGKTRQKFERYTFLYIPTESTDWKVQGDHVN